MEFVIVGSHLTTPRNEIERMVKKMGGKIVPNIHHKVAAVISNENEVRKMSKPILTAKLYDIQVVSEQFFIDVYESNIDPVWYIVTKNISEWGGDVSIFMLVFILFLYSLKKTIQFHLICSH